jgi:hypothetical protein
MTEEIVNVSSTDLVHVIPNRVNTIEATLFVPEAVIVERVGYAPDMELTQAHMDERVEQTPPERRTDALTKKERLAICKACPELTTFAGFDQCGKCKCFVLFKASFKGSDCPLNKWSIPDDLPARDLPSGTPPPPNTTA